MNGLSSQRETAAGEGVRPLEPQAGISSAAPSSEVEREVLRCPHCDLNQFATATGKCRRCRGVLVVPLAASDVRTTLAIVDVANLHMPTYYDTLARLLYSVREAQGLSQRQLALKMGVPRPYISKIENQKARPALVSLGRFCAALEIPLSGLINCVEAAVNLQ